MHDVDIQMNEVKVAKEYVLVTLNASLESILYFENYKYSFEWMQYLENRVQPVSPYWAEHTHFPCCQSAQTHTLKTDTPPPSHRVMPAREASFIPGQSWVRDCSNGGNKETWEFRSPVQNC